MSIIDINISFNAFVVFAQGGFLKLTNALTVRGHKWPPLL